MLCSGHCWRALLYGAEVKRALAVTTDLYIVAGQDEAENVLQAKLDG